MDNKFKKGNLSNGCILGTKRGNKYIFLKNAKNGVYDNMDLLINIQTGGHLALDIYNDNLEDMDYDHDHDIIKICDMDFVGDNIRNHMIKNTDYWTAVKEKNKEEELKEIIEEIRIKTEALNEIMKRYKELKEVE